MHRFAFVRTAAAALTACILVACGESARLESPPVTVEEVTSVPSPRFADPQLQAIAERVTEEAQRRGIQSVRGRWNRVESLIQLESELGAPPFALEHVNTVAMRAVRTDSGYWGSIRARELARCETLGDAGCVRVRDLIQRWYRQRLAIITEGLGSEKFVHRYGGDDWERHFHAFIRRTPLDAATWAWIVSRNAGADVRASIGGEDAEAAYRYYLATTHLGTAREAAEIFSVPGVEVRER